MSLGALIFLLFFIFIIVMCCGWCCKSKRRGVVLSTPVVVTSATHTAPGGYPVTQLPPNTTYQYAPYPQGAPTQMQMPMPMPMAAAVVPPQPGMQTYSSVTAQTAPYPATANLNPPSYDMVIGSGGPGQSNTAAYEKQAPYNPNYGPQ